MALLTIDQESKKRLRSPLDIDKMAIRYKTNNGIYTFTSPQIKKLESNVFYLLKESKQVQMSREYVYKPEYLSYDEYGTVVLAKVLMYVNGIYTPEEFDLDIVSIPSMSAIMKVASKKISNTKDGIEW